MDSDVFALFEHGFERVREFLRVSILEWHVFEALIGGRVVEQFNQRLERCIVFRTPGDEDDIGSGCSLTNGPTA